jgi:hypothetical protein
MEIWKDIKGFEGIYEVSNLGNVRSLDRLVWNKANKVFQKTKGKLLKPDSQNKNYKQVNLSNLEKSKKFLVHRLVALTFIPNPENKPQVNHLNEQKLDNRLENLEWATVSENVNYGNRNYLSSLKSSKAVIMKDKNGNELKRYRSATEAEKDGFSRFCICFCCKGKIKSHKDYKWEYA